MKRLISILLLFAFFAAFPAFAEQGEQFVLCKPGTVVNVRKRPEKDAPVTAWVECGQKITVDDEKNGFVHVSGLASEIPDGWIFAGYVVEEEPVIREYKAEVWEGPVIARKSVNGKQVRVLKDGKTVTVYAKTHCWAVTNKGFIMTDWLREVEE